MDKAQIDRKLEIAQDAPIFSSDGGKVILVFDPEVAPIPPWMERLPIELLPIKAQNGRS